MPDSLKDFGARQGFEHGWHDGMRGVPRLTRPDIGYSLLDVDYLGAYNRSYFDAYDTALEEKKRQEELKARRRERNWERER